MGRLVLLLLVVGVGLWLYKNSAGGLLGSRGKETGSSAPIERARDAARKADARQAEIDRLFLAWGLRSVSGLQLDGAEASPESLAEAGPEELCREALAAVRAQTGLTGEERKN